jgi:phosphatidylethanolamine/phosphatidyl-N-methylethanolamine N-methyltransferase
MNRVLSELKAAWLFMQTGFRQIDKNASLFPSSRFLVEAMVAPVGVEHARCIVELGPGTGALTKVILAKMHPDAHLHAIELDGELLRTTTKLVNDPRLRPHHGSAAEAVKLVRASGCTHSSAIISSLGLALMTDALRANVLSEACELLTPDGIFAQYSYPAARVITYQFKQGFTRFHGRKLLEEYFRDVRSKVVWLNMPSAVVYTCRAPFVKTGPLPFPKQRSRKPPRRSLRVVGGKR